MAGLFNEHSWRSPLLPSSPEEYPNWSRGVIHLHTVVGNDMSLSTILTADCISLVRAVGALWLAIAAPPGWNALAVLTGKVRGRACLLCCGGKYHISNTTTRGFSPFTTF